MSADAGATASQPSTHRSRQYGMALAGLVLGAALMFLALAQDWVRATAGSAGAPAIEVVLTGRVLVPAAAGAAVVLLAGAAGVVAARGRWRTVVGIVLLLVATGAAVGIARFGIGGPATARLTSELGTPATSVSTSMWWLVALGGAALAGLAGLAVAVWGSAWPVLASRFERQSARAQATPTGNSAARIWDALDRGEDPTK